MQFIRFRTGWQLLNEKRGINLASQERYRLEGGAASVGEKFCSAPICGSLQSLICGSLQSLTFLTVQINTGE
jgi:hypothetical protein